MSIKLDMSGLLIDCLSIGEAQIKYCDARDQHDASNGPTAERFPDGMLNVDGVVYRVAYNGSIWANGKKVYA